MFIAIENYFKKKNELRYTFETKTVNKLNGNFSTIDNEIIIKKK